MKLVNRRLMLQMPVSTIYCPWIPNSYVELFIFTGLIDNEDWQAIKLINGVKTALFLDPCFVKSVTKFTPENGETCSQLYMVFEQDDLQTLLARITAGLAASLNYPQQTFGD